MALDRRATILGLLALLLLSVAGYSPLVLHIVIGYSMYPTFKPGDLVVSTNTLLTGYDVGDVAVYCVSLGNCVVHRIEYIEDDTVIFKGDNNAASDPPVSRDQVKYRVIARIPLPVWMPPVVALAVSRLAGVRLRSPEAAGLLIFIIVIALAAYTSAAPPQEVNLPLPHAVLERTEVDYTVFRVVFKVNNAVVESIDSCMVSVQVVSERCLWSNYTVHQLPVGYRVVMEAGIPEGILARAYREGRNELLLLANMSLSGGINMTVKVKGYVPWREPTFTLRNGILNIENPLPFTMHVVANATLFKSTWPRYDAVHNVIEASVEPLGSASLNLEEEYRYARVRVAYTLVEPGVGGVVVLGDAG